MLYNSKRIWALLGGITLLGACNLGVAEDTADAKDGASSSSLESSLNSSSSATASQNNWSVWDKPESANRIAVTWAAQLDEANGVLVLHQSKAHCENGQYVQDSQKDTLRYQKNDLGLVVWGGMDCKAMQFKGSNTGVQGQWSLAGTTEIPGGALVDCEGEGGGGEFKSLDIEIKSDALVLNGQVCPTHRLGEMFQNPELLVTVVDCNRAKVTVMGKTALVRVEQPNMDGLYLQLFFEGTECKIDAKPPMDASMCTMMNDPWQNFGQCVSTLGLPLWGDKNSDDNNTGMNDGMHACFQGTSCFESPTMPACAGGQLMEHCPATSHLVCPVGDGKMFIYDTSKQSCEGI